MNQLFLLKLIKEMLKDDKPSVDEIRCTRKIVNEMIEANIPPISSQQQEGIIYDPNLDEEAQQARKDLIG